MQHATMQLTVDLERAAFDIHVTRRTGDRETPPHLRHYRNITLASLARFYALSEGKRTAYSTKGN